MTELARRIVHAESYPFARPASCYLFRRGGMHPLLRGTTKNRLPVIASGSNASPDRLSAKFGEQGEIPVTRATLRHFAVVFAGHFTAYGAIPATLYPHEGAVTEVWITWLTNEQLAIMHRSEGVIGCREAVQRYDYVELSDIELRPNGMGPIDRAGAYLSRRMLAPEGSPIRMAEVLCRNCCLQARSERSMLRQTHGMLDRKVGFGDFMTSVLSGPDRRQSLFEQLSPYVIHRSR